MYRPTATAAALRVWTLVLQMSAFLIALNTVSTMALSLQLALAAHRRNDAMRFQQPLEAHGKTNGKGRQFGARCCFQ